MNHINMQRNYSIDSLKAVCAILVVFLHAKYVYQSAIIPLARCAVPCFFMISGYLLYKSGGIGTERLKRSIRHILKICVWATLLFVVWQAVFGVLTNDPLSFPSVRTMIVWVVFNQCPFGFHLWYLYAYLYVLLIVYVIDKHKKWKWLFISAPILLLASVVFYVLPFLHIELPLVCHRNFIFVGLPYFTMGALIKELWTKQLPNKLNIFGIILFATTSIIESVIWAKFGIDRGPETYLSTPLLSLSLLLLFLSLKETKPTWLSINGERDSLYIYILHPIFFNILTLLFMRRGWQHIYSLISPFVIYVFTLAAIIILRKIKVLKS